MLVSFFSCRVEAPIPVPCLDVATLHPVVDVAVVVPEFLERPVAPQRNLHLILGQPLPPRFLATPLMIASDRMPMAIDIGS